MEIKNSENKRNNQARDNERRATLRYFVDYLRINVAAAAAAAASGETSLNHGAILIAPEYINDMH